jgi:hypothetical protein
MPALLLGNDRSGTIAHVTPNLFDPREVLLRKDQPTGSSVLGASPRARDEEPSVSPNDPKSRLLSRATLTRRQSGLKS